MNCKDVQTLLMTTPDLNETLNDPDIAAHFETCSDCQVRLVCEKQLQEGFLAIAERTPPQELAGKVLSIPQQVQRTEADTDTDTESEGKTSWLRSLLGPLWWKPAAAAMGVGFLLAIGLHQMTSSRKPSVTTQREQASGEASTQLAQKPPTPAVPLEIPAAAPETSATEDAGTVDATAKDLGAANEAVVEEAAPLPADASFADAMDNGDSPTTTGTTTPEPEAGSPVPESGNVQLALAPKDAPSAGLTSPLQAPPLMPKPADAPVEPVVSVSTVVETDQVAEGEQKSGDAVAPPVAEAVPVSPGDKPSEPVAAPVMLAAVPSQPQASNVTPAQDQEKREQVAVIPPEPKKETKQEPKQEPKQAVKLKSSPESQSEPKSEPKPASKSAPKSAPKPVTKVAASAVAAVPPSPQAKNMMLARADTTRARSVAPSPSRKSGRHVAKRESATAALPTAPTNQVFLRMADDETSVSRSRAGDQSLAPDAAQRPAETTGGAAPISSKQWADARSANTLRAAASPPTSFEKHPTGKQIESLIRERKIPVREGILDISAWVIDKTITVKERIALAPPPGKAWYATRRGGGWAIFLCPGDDLDF